MTNSEWARFYEFCRWCKPGKEVKIDADRLIAVARECQEAGMGGLDLCIGYEGAFNTDNPE